MELRCFHVHLSSNYDSTGRIRDRIQIVLLTDKEMEVRHSLVDSSSNLGSNYDSTRRMRDRIQIAIVIDKGRKGSIYYLLSDSNQITIVVGKEMEVRCFHVYLSSNYDQTRRIRDRIQIAIVTNKEMEVRCFHVYLSSNYGSTST